MLLGVRLIRLATPGNFSRSSTLNSVSIVGAPSPCDTTPYSKRELFESDSSASSSKKARPSQRPNTLQPRALPFEAAAAQPPQPPQATGVFSAVPPPPTVSVTRHVPAHVLPHTKGVDAQTTAPLLSMPVTHSIPVPKVQHQHQQQQLTQQQVLQAAQQAASSRTLPSQAHAPCPGASSIPTSPPCQVTSSAATKPATFQMETHTPDGHARSEQSHPAAADCNAHSSQLCPATPASLTTANGHACSDQTRITGSCEPRAAGREPPHAHHATAWNWRLSSIPPEFAPSSPASKASNAHTAFDAATSRIATATPWHAGET